MVGVDGSQHSLRALAWACREAQLRHDSLELVSAWSLPAISSAGESEEVVEILQESAQEVVEAARRRVRELAPEVEVTTRVYHGQPARVLVERAAEAELLVVGSRGLGEFKALLLGSVSQECSQHSPVPVVIVRDHEDARTPGGPPG
ncbi:MAG: universal stress protein [Candidatus Dormibacteria bacterium]